MKVDLFPRFTQSLETRLKGQRETEFPPPPAGGDKGESFGPPRERGGKKLGFFLFGSPLGFEG